MGEPKNIPNFTYTPGDYVKPGHYERGTHRLIEDYKTYRIQDGNKTTLLRIKSKSGNTITFTDLGTGKTVTMDKSSFQSRLNKGDIYVSSNLLEVLRKVVA